MRPTCSHTHAILPVAAPHDVCDACVPIGGTWVHLRQCLACGRTLCCDNSPNRHMSGHFAEVGHPLMSGADPGDAWTWCFIDGEMVRMTGDDLERYDPFVEAGTVMAKQHLHARGDADPPQDLVTEFGFPLGEWFAYVRETHETGDLEADDAELIEALPGWHW